MNKYEDFTKLYEKSGDSSDSYHGGYLLEKNNSENNYLGGKKSTFSRYNKIVVPFGLFYKNRMNDLHEDVADKLLDNKKETECIEPDLFDRLFYAVGRVELPKKEKYTNNKTKKLNI